MSDNKTKSNSMLKMISVAAILVFVIVCGLGVGPKIMERVNSKSENERILAEDMAIASGEKEPSAAYLARVSGMSVEDYLAQYGLTLGDEITAETTLTDLGDNMTIANYISFRNDTEGANIELDSYLEQFSDAVTADTVMKDLYAMSAETALGSDVFNATKEQYNLGDEITGETTFEEFENALYNAAIAQQAAQAEQNTEAEVPAEEAAE